MEWPEFDYRQPFDLKADPGELRNLIAEESHAPRRSRMATPPARANFRRSSLV